MAVSKGWRGLVSMVMFSSGFISAITGLVLYILPEGRVANWTIWDLFGVSKAGWQSIHTNSSFLMLIFGIFHLLNNWGSIKNYIVKKAGGGLNQTGNMILVATVSIIIVTTSIFALPPMQWIMDIGQGFKNMWVTAPQYEPPFGHAEELSLAGFCRRMYIDLDSAMSELRSSGLQVESEKQSLSEIAQTNNTRPMDIYMVIKHLESVPKIDAGQSITVAEIEALYGPGTGSGRKSVAEIAELVNIDLNLAIQRLEKAGIEATPKMLLKDIKDANSQLDTASDIVLIMLDIK